MPIIDPRDRELAKLLINYSVKAKKGDVVFIDGIGLETAGLCQAIMEEAASVGAAPYVQLTDMEIRRKLFHTANEAVFQRLGEFELTQMKATQCYIGIRGASNIFETADVPRKQMSLYNKYIGKPVHFEQRVKHTRWCVLRYPNAAMAQLSQQPREAFADFYYSVCNVDYAQMAKACKPLKALMEKTNIVHIKGPGETNLTFSIKGIPAIPCCGEMNIPDGECFTAPVKESINGVVQFNAGTVWEGTPYDDVRLVFKNGKVVEAAAADAAQTKKLNGVLDQDEGARYVGEFAIGFNPSVLKPMRDILFDEKISGSFHMAMGNSYDEADNTNKSAVHWDMVCIQRPEYGGGEIHFDGKLIRKDGIFVHKSLEGLNPAALGAQKAPAKKAPAKKKK